MTANTVSTSDRVWRQTIPGSRRPSNYFWAVVVTGGATGFLLSGISSYTQVNLLPFSDPTQLEFLPQGAVMGFYGIAGLLLALYLWLTLVLNIGGGYNEFNRETGKGKIFRWGFPGKNRRIEVECNLEDIQSVRIEVKEGLNPKRALYLKVKGMRDIPLTPAGGEPMRLSDLENRGAELARFLGVPLEGM
jgi:hypothetical protein